MARDIPHIPRFYIDHIQFLRHCGIIGMFDAQNEDIILEDYADVNYLETNFNRLFDYNPTNQSYLTYATDFGLTSLEDNRQTITIPTGMNHISDFDGKWYLAVCGHNFWNSSTQLKLRYNNGTENQAHIDTTEIINSSAFGAYNGFSIEEFTDKPQDNEFAKNINLSLCSRNTDLFLTDINIGSIMFGKYFDLSIASDTKMTLEIQYGVKSKKTKSGSHLSNMEWWQKPTWGNLPAWELDRDLDTNYLSKENKDLGWRKSGRRVYDLSFTFLSSDDVLATSGVLDGTTLEGNQFEGDLSGNLTDTNADDVAVSVHDESSPINIKNDNSIFAQIVHKTMGFQLPFIFQPNKDYAKPDGFMLARIANKSYELEQLATNLWRCKFKIEEIW